MILDSTSIVTIGSLKREQNEIRLATKFAPISYLRLQLTEGQG